MSMQTGSIDKDGLARTSDGKLYVTLGSGSALDPSAVVFGAEDTITAFAGGGQTSATALSATKSYHRVSVCATAADSVKLPAATVGQAHYLRNDGAASMQVFGQATETIDGVASATGVPQVAGAGTWYVCTTAGAWTRSPGSAITLGNGAAATPSLSWANSPTTGFFSSSANALDIAYANTARTRFSTGQIITDAGYAFVVGGGSLSSPDVSITRAAANSLQFGQTAATTTARTQLNKAVAAITNAAATDVLTVTIPNAAHSACLEVEVIGSLGAGGAIGANEATASNTYKFVITRTAGVATVVATSAAYGAAAAAVAGAATVTCTAAATAMTGVVSATQTFTIQATISRSAGSSTNHTCLVYAKLMNANATGVTIA